MEDRREWAVAHSPQRDDCFCDPLDSRESLGGVAEQSLGRFRSCCWFRVPAALRGDAAEQLFMCGSESQVVELQMERMVARSGVAMTIHCLLLFRLRFIVPQGAPQ